MFKSIFSSITIKHLAYLLIPVLILGLSIGVTAERVPDIEIKTPTEGYDPIRYEAAFLIQENMEELGIQVSVEPVEFSALMQDLFHDHDFEIAISGWSGRVERLDPQHFMAILSKDQASPGGNNPGNWLNDRYDELFYLQSKELDREQRREYVFEMQEILADEQPKNVLFYRDEVVAYNHNNFEGFDPMAGEGIYNEWIQFDVEPVGEDRMLTIGTTQEPDNINPLDSTTGWGWRFMRLYYDKLIRLSTDNEPVPWAAESVEAIGETTFEVVLREGMTFHDGEPVTVDDVKFTFDYYREQDYAYFRAYYQPIEEVVIVDDNTLHFELEVPTPTFITVTLSQIPILPKHLWEDIEAADQLSPEDIPKVGSGPLKFATYNRGEYMRIDKYEDYFKADDVNIDGIEYIIYADEEGLFTDLITGEVDVFPRRMKPTQARLAEQADHLTVVRVPDIGYYYMVYNLRVPPMDDVEFRRALAHTVPHEVIIDGLLGGYGERSTSTISPANSYWHNPNVSLYDYDLDLARERLEDAGYWWDDEGRLNFPE